MQIGGLMDSEQIRLKLSGLASQRGELNRFCKKNGLPYFTLWRFSSGAIGKLEYELGIKISAALESEDQNA